MACDQPKALAITGFNSCDICSRNSIWASESITPSVSAIPCSGICAPWHYAKSSRMPLEWHNRKDSGVLAGEVNSGVGKVVQTAESLSRKFEPNFIAWRNDFFIAHKG